MTTIKEALQRQEPGLRLVYNSRWLYFDTDGNWIVREQRPYARTSTVLYEGSDEEAAVAILLEE